VLDWPLITGGKAIVSLPPFVVIAFELTILCAALMTVAGFLLSSRLPRLRQAPYDARFSQDRWGVLVTCVPERAEAARAHLKQADAEEVRVVEGTR
jgi:molybdopterin-containing oxidoreductase family membrane subunit